MRRFKRAFQVSVFVILGLCLFIRTAEIVRPKQGGENADLMHSLYSIEKNTVDVVFLGSSLSYHGIQPNVIFHENGFTSVCMNSPSQSIPTSYYVLQETLRYQQPKVVVLESYAIWNDQKFYNKERLHAVSDPLRYGLPKLKMLADMTEGFSFSEKIPFYVPFVLYHERWSSLQKADFSTPQFLKGSVIKKNVFDNKEVFLPSEKQPVPEIVTDYFEKIVDLCEENGIELFVVQVPVGTYTGDDWPTFTYDLLCMENTFFEYLDQKGIPYKFYQKTRELDLDWSADFTDSTHLNRSGQKKLSTALGAYLSDYYDLPDHRGDPEYSDWERDYELYLKAAWTE